jgi:hypothetical protein
LDLASVSVANGIMKKSRSRLREGRSECSHRLLWYSNFQEIQGLPDHIPPSVIRIANKSRRLRKHLPCGLVLKGSSALPLLAKSYNSSEQITQDVNTDVALCVDKQTSLIRKMQTSMAKRATTARDGRMSTHRSGKDDVNAMKSTKAAGKAKISTQSSENQHTLRCTFSQYMT